MEKLILVRHKYLGTQATFRIDPTGSVRGSGQAFDKYIEEAMYELGVENLDFLEIILPK